MSLPHYRSFAASVADDDEARVDGEAFVERLHDSMTPEQRAVVDRPSTTYLLRSIKAVWDVAAALCKRDGVTRLDWQRSEEGVRCALAVCGYVLVPGSVGEAPTQVRGLAYLKRKVEVWRDGERSKPTQFDVLMTGNSGLSTTEERDVINADKSELQKARRPKGVATTHNDQAARSTIT